MLGRVEHAGKGDDRYRTMAACHAGPYGSRYGPGEPLEGGEVPLRNHAEVIARPCWRRVWA
jgi:hypothetical protein